MNFKAGQRVVTKTAIPYRKIPQGTLAVVAYDQRQNEDTVELIIDRLSWYKIPTKYLRLATKLDELLAGVEDEI